MLLEIHKLRKSTSIATCNQVKLQAHVAKLKSDIEILQIQLSHSQEDSTVYRGQVTSLQSYIRSISFVKEQFDGSRVAGNQIKIMQDLQQENIKTRSENEILRGKIKDLECDIAV
jgi:cell division protein FtsB